MRATALVRSINSVTCASFFLYFLVHKIHEKRISKAENNNMRGEPVENQFGTDHVSDVCSLRRYLASLVGVSIFAFVTDACTADQNDRKVPPPCAVPSHGQNVVSISTTPTYQLWARCIPLYISGNPQYFGKIGCHAMSLLHHSLMEPAKYLFRPSASALPHTVMSPPTETL